MELQHDVGRERHVAVGLVNELEPVAVAGDLLLGAVARFRALDHQIGDASRRGDHALDPVGGLGGFHHRAGAERFELLRDLAEEEVLPATGLAQAMDGASSEAPKVS